MNVSSIQQNLTPNATLGAYRLTERIGKGGFSEVWSAWDTHLNRLVAIKIIPRTSNDAYSTIQFGREAAMITRLEHPHVLPLYDFAETPELRYLVMRYVTGGSLAQRIEHGRLPITKIVQLMTPIAETLDYIHEQRVVHRDLKPGNILLDAQESPYLADFGLAKELTDETRPVHSASGTLTFMPPEQFSGGILSTRSDMYSFGILLYQLFSGRLPFDGQYALGMRQLAQGDALEDVTLNNPELPLALNDLLRQLTAQEPAKRPEKVAVAMQQIAELFYGSKLSLSPTAPTAQSGITVALESGAYRQREAESLIGQNLTIWQNGGFSLSATHFALLDILLRELDKLLTPDVRSLMLRGALEHDHQIEYWWAKCTEIERQRACWQAITHGSDAVCVRAIRVAVDMPWIRNAPPEIINAASKHLLLPSDAAITLSFLEKALPTSDLWLTDNRLQATDDRLGALALSKTPVAERAAILIGRARRTRAMLGLVQAPGSQALIAYETARSLPETLPNAKRFQLTLLLAFRQLTRQPLAAFGEYVWVALGNTLALALMVYILFRAEDLLNFFYEKRVLNGLGLGLLFGLPYAVGIWVARHIAQRLLVLPFALRVLVGVLLGGLIVAEGFSLYQRLVNLDVIAPYIAIASGILYVFGFAISVKLRFVWQLLISAAGVAAAFLFPWFSYLVNPDLRPPFIFDENRPETAVPLVIVASIILAFFALGYVWRPMLRRTLLRRST